MDTTMEDGLVKRAATHAKRVLSVRWDVTWLQSGATGDIHTSIHHAFVINGRSVLLVARVDARVVTLNATRLETTTTDVSIAWVDHRRGHLGASL